MNETNLTPMEAALLDFLQKLSVEHEQRLNELEQLLKGFAERSKDDSSSDRKSVDELMKQLTRLETALGSLSEQVGTCLKESRAMKENYGRAVESFNSMKGQYLQLASEVAQLRKLAG